MRSCVLLYSCLFALACNHVEKDTATATAFDLAAVKNHINEMNKSYGDRFIRNDTAFYISRYCKDAVAMPEKMASVNGRRSIMNYYYANGANKEFKIHISAENIYGNNDFVVEEGTYSFPDEKGGSFDNGKFIALWKQEEGTWKLFREIWNTSKPQTVQ